MVVRRPTMEGRRVMFICQSDVWHVTGDNLEMAKSKAPRESAAAWEAFFLLAITCGEADEGESVDS